MVHAQRTEERGILAYFASPTNWVDLLEYALMTASVGVWCSVYFGSMLDTLQPDDVEPRADVYEDFFASSYLLKMRRIAEQVRATFFDDLRGGRKAEAPRSLPSGTRRSSTTSPA